MTSSGNQLSQAPRLSVLTNVLLKPFNTYVNKWLQVQPPNASGHTIQPNGERQGRHRRKYKEHCQLWICNRWHRVMRSWGFFCNSYLCFDICWKVFIMKLNFTMERKFWASAEWKLHFWAGTNYSITCLRLTVLNGFNSCPKLIKGLSEEAHQHSADLWLFRSLLREKLVQRL